MIKISSPLTNQYDDHDFFERYKQMNRSQHGLSGAGEWHELKSMLPNFNGKSVLDLGCGYGWHCTYAAEQGASYVVGIDSSEKMLEEAQTRKNSTVVHYKKQRIEDMDFPENSFDIVLSSLAFHYVKSFDSICANVSNCIVDGGDFVFSVENPIFTAYGSGDWIYDKDGNISHWPVDRYFFEGERNPNFLGKEICKYHKTFATYVNTLVQHGFAITKVVEPMPEESMLDNDVSMQNELRRPMMLIIAAKKLHNNNK